MTPIETKWYGWKRDLPDQRDFPFIPPLAIAKLPARVDLRPRCPDVYNQGALGSCFPPGTLIRMADGSSRAIESVELLERVVTAEGNVRRVTMKWARDVEDGLVRISLHGHQHLRVTSEHPVLTRRGYVKAAELCSKTDYVRMTDYIPKRWEEAIRIDNFLPMDKRRLTTGWRTFKAPLGRRSGQYRSQPIPDKLPLTKGTGRLLGLFLAEGSLSSGKAIWTFGLHETDTLVAETVRLLREEWGVEAAVQPKPANHSVNVVLYGTGWSHLLYGLCGNGAGMKRLHPAVWLGGVDVLREVLNGWLDGDGWRKKTGGRAGVTISHELALNMYDIAQALGQRPTIRREDRRPNAGAKTRRPAWTVEMSCLSGEDTYRCKMDESGHVWRRVRSVETIQYVGPVYNLSVEQEESYVAEGIGVHNCTANAIAAAMQFQKKRQAAPSRRPSRLFIYYGERELEGTVGQDAGAYIRDGMKVAQSIGAPPETKWPYVISRFAVKPSTTAYRAALDHQVIAYRRLTQAVSDMKACLAGGAPFVFGFTVYESFESEGVTRTGVVPMPSVEENVLGGHAVLAVGYDDATQRFIVRNSWGAGWGAKGYCTMPYAYLRSPNLAADFWTVETVE